MSFFSVVTVNLSEMRVKLRVKPNVENERSCFMHSVGWAPETKQFPCFIVVASPRGLHIGTRGQGSSYPHKTA